jgi:tetratricopeptide (TPR) repeat protein
MALDLLGALQRDDKLLAEALVLYNGLLEACNHTAKGRANLLSLIGTTHRHRMDWENARQAYVRALETEPSAILKVFLCDCLLQLDELEQAVRNFSEVGFNDLAPAEKVDYAFTAAALTIETGERDRLQNAILILKAVKPLEPIFRERRDAFLLNLQEAIASGASKSLSQRTKRLLATIARSATSYLILKPSFMGIGVDIGKMVEELARRSQTEGPKKEGPVASSTRPPTKK